MTELSEKNGIETKEKSALPVELQVLDLFIGANLLLLGPSDVERLTGVSKGTVSGKLRMMAEAGYLQAAGAGKYRLGSKLFTLMMAYAALTLHQMDQVQDMMNRNFLQIRSSMQQFVSAFPVAVATPSPAQPTGGEA
jgi:DNA-binding IclR family transcriptional regulator